MKSASSAAAKRHRARLFLFTGTGANARSTDDVATVLGGVDGGRRFEVVALDHVPPNLDRAHFDAVVFAGGSGRQQADALGHAGRAAVRRFVREQGGGWVGICAGSYLACDPCSSGGAARDGFPLGIVPGLAVWPHALWGRGDHLSGTIVVDAPTGADGSGGAGEGEGGGEEEEAEEEEGAEEEAVCALGATTASGYECNFCNGSLFDRAALPAEVAVLGVVGAGVGSHAQRAGMEGKAIVIAAPSVASPAPAGGAPRTVGRVVLSGCHAERDTTALRGVRGVLEALVEHALPPLAVTHGGGEVDAEGDEQANGGGGNGGGGDGGRTERFACPCSKCRPLDAEAAAAAEAEEIRRKRAVRAQVEAMEDEWLAQLFSGELLPALSPADFSPRLLAERRARWLARVSVTVAVQAQAPAGGVERATVGDHGIVADEREDGGTGRSSAARGEAEAR